MALEPGELHCVIDALDRRYCHPATAVNCDPQVGDLLDAVLPLLKADVEREEAEHETQYLTEWLQDYAEQLSAAAKDLPEEQLVAAVLNIAERMRAAAR